MLIEEVFEEIYKEYYSLVVYNTFKYETNKQNIEEILNYIKDKLPDCYICNLDGKVIRK